LNFGTVKVGRNKVKRLTFTNTAMRKVDDRDFQQRKYLWFERILGSEDLQWARRTEGKS